MFLKLILSAGFGVVLFSPRTEAAEDQMDPRARKVNDKERIVGGSTDDPKHSHPWQIMLLVNNKMCSGSLVHEKFVLTAAHCVSGPISSSLLIAGAHSWCTYSNGAYYFQREPTQQYSVIKKVHFHQIPYNPSTKKFDIALVELSRPFVLNDMVQTISLTKKIWTSNETVTVSGWGSTSEGGTLACDLQKVNVPIVDFSQCKSTYRLVSGIQMCAGFLEGGKDACQGDSGGPLVKNDGNETVLIGLVSFGNGCARPVYFGVYTNVFFYVSWINSIVKGETAKMCTGENFSRVSDGFCDDELNTSECLFDGGDCCSQTNVSSIRNKFCTTCQCLH